MGQQTRDSNFVATEELSRIGSMLSTIGNVKIKNPQVWAFYCNAIKVVIQALPYLLSFRSLLQISRSRNLLKLLWPKASILRIIQAKTRDMRVIAQHNVLKSKWQNGLPES